MRVPRSMVGVSAGCLDGDRPGDDGPDTDTLDGCRGDEASAIHGPRVGTTEMAKYIHEGLNCRGIPFGPAVHHIATARILRISRIPESDRRVQLLHLGKTRE
jgi:hypothetical protein